MLIYTLLRRGALRSGEVARIVVQAPTESRARELASRKARGEGTETWLSPTRSSCLQRGSVREDVLEVEVL